MAEYTVDQEKADLQEALDQHRYFLTHTAQGLTDEQARATPTVSELHVGGLIKHVTSVVRGWLAFMTGGDQAEAAGDWWQGHHMSDTDTLEALLADFAAVAAETDAVLRATDLDESHRLPDAPWFPEGKTWTNRRVVVHLVAEIAQHAGHADIIRETIDGQKTMG